MSVLDVHNAGGTPTANTGWPNPSQTLYRKLFTTGSSSRRLSSKCSGEVLHLDRRPRGGDHGRQLESESRRDKCKCKSHEGLGLKQCFSHCDIVALTGYRSQHLSLRKAIGPGKNRNCEIAVVDAFQGREKEYLILVWTEKVGFSADFRSANVAITRFKRHLCVVGDLRFWRSRQSDTPLIAALAEFAVENELAKTVTQRMYIVSIHAEA